MYFDHMDPHLSPPTSANLFHLPNESPSSTFMCAHVYDSEFNYGCLQDRGNFPVATHCPG